MCKPPRHHFSFSGFLGAPAPDGAGLEERGLWHGDGVRKRESDFILDVCLELLHQMPFYFTYIEANKKGVEKWTHATLMISSMMWRKSPKT